MSNRKRNGAIKFDSPLDGALWMAKHGFRVLPLMPDSKDPFSMGKCSKRNEALAGGINKATIKPETIKAWAVINPDINFGIAAGDGLFILDPDVKDGKTGLDDLKQFGELPRTLTVCTWSGGQHIYYKTEEQLAQTDLTDSINTRSKGGYVVAPGSRISGVPYTIIDSPPLALLPDCIREKLRARKQKTHDAGEWLCKPDHPHDIARATEWLKTLKPVPEGYRNNECIATAFRLRDYGLSAAARFDLMIEHWPCYYSESFTFDHVQERCNAADASAGNPGGVGSTEHMLRDFDDVSGIDKDGNLVPRQSVNEILEELAKKPAPPPTPPPLLSTAKPFESAKQFLKRQCSNRGVRTLHRIDGRFLSYTGAHYEHAEDETIKGRVWRFLQSARRIAEVKKIVDGKKVKVASEVPFDPKTTHVNDVFNAVVAQTQLKVNTLPCWAPVKSKHAEKRCPATEIMPCKNGLLNLKTRTLLPHTPEYIGLNSLPYAYDPRAGAPRELLKFMQSIWPNDAESAQLLQEWFGYVLSGATDQQKIMLLVGATRGGKGVIGRLLRALVGEANAAGPTLGSLAEPFGIEPLIGKLLATVSDGRLGKFTDGSAITERLLSISGEDALSVQRKFLTAWQGRLPARLMLLMNQAPALSDAAGALSRRFLVLSFSESFHGREDRGLEKRLLAELPAILNWALAGLDRLNTRGHFVQPAAGQQVIQTIEELASPVAAFVGQRCELHEDGEVKCSDLHTAYCDWCREEEGRRPLAQSTFGAELLAAFPKVKRTRLRVDGELAYVYDGLKLLPTPYDPSNPFAKTAR